MRFSTRTQAGPACVSASAGVVMFNGAQLLPHEAAMLGDALVACGERAEKLGALELQASALQVEGQKIGQEIIVLS